MPFSSRYRITKAFDIPIYVDTSFCLIMLLMVINSGSIFEGLITAALLAFSIVAHELGHALTAASFGYRTRDITISLLGGCASLIALPRTAWKEFLTAIAGPAVSFALSGIAYLALLILPLPRLFVFALSYLCWMNLMLGAFNLLPGFPMDGGRVFRSVMRIFTSRVQATLIAMWVGRGFAILLGLSGLNAIMSGGSWGFVRILIAWMIWKEGYQEYLAARDEERYRPWTEADFEAKVSPPPYNR